MTVAELIEKLKTFPQESNIVISVEEDLHNAEFDEVANEVSLY